MAINLDFSSVPGNVLLDEGTYNVSIKKVEEKVSSTGKPMLFVVFEEEETKTGIFENYVLTAECLWKVKELLAAAGYETSGALEFDPQELIGLVFKAKVVQEDYNDSKTNRIKKIFAA